MNPWFNSSCISEQEVSLNKCHAFSLGTTRILDKNDDH